MSVNLNTISTAIQQRNYRAAEQGFSHILQHLAEYGFSFDEPAPGGNIFTQPKIDIEQEVTNFCNQFVTILSTLFAQRDYLPSAEMYYYCANGKFVLESIFIGSVWKTSDALIEHLGLYKTDENGQVRVSERELYLFLMLVFPSSKFSFDYRDLFETNSMLAVETVIGLVSQKYNVLTEKSSKSVDKIFKQAEDFPVVEFSSLDVIQLLPNSFFSCSYYDSEYKYIYKQWLVDLIKHNIDRKIDVAKYEKKPNISYSTGERKLKVLVVLERYGLNHAMYRCYNSMFESLSKNYEVIGCGVYDEKNADTLYKPFHSFVNIDDPADIEGTMKKVSEVNADVIFYPSIGMNVFGVYLSQYRLAPVQLMMAGHPSSPMSDNIDKLLIPNGRHVYGGIENYIKEEPVFLRDKENKVPCFYDFPTSVTPEHVAKLNSYTSVNGGDVKVAVNGAAHKVSYRLLEACKEIQARTTNNVKFIFFCGDDKNSMHGIAAKKIISKDLPNAVFYYKQDYKSYLKVISECHFCLPTFPFGGSNSNIDAMLLNKPKLFIKGTEEFYTRTDHYDWDSINMADELGCKDLSELVEKSVHLVENESELERLHSKIKDADVMNTRFINDNNQNDALIDLFEEVLEDIQA